MWRVILLFLIMGWLIILVVCLKVELLKFSIVIVKLLSYWIEEVVIEDYMVVFGNFNIIILSISVESKDIVMFEINIMIGIELCFVNGNGIKKFWVGK